MPSSASPSASPSPSRPRRSLISSNIWLARIFRTRAFPPREVDAQLWAVVTKCGDRDWGETDAAPLRGLRIALFNNEEHACIAGARALVEAVNTGALPPESILPVHQRFKDQPMPVPLKVLRAVSSEDAGGLGGNTAAARRYWTTLAAASETESDGRQDQGAAPSSASGTFT